MSLLRVVVLAALFAAGTWFIGWYSVPGIAAVYALLLRSRTAPSEATLAAVLAWGALLARVALHPAFTTLLSRLTVLFGMQGTFVLVLTIVFAAVLAWSAARVVTAAFSRERMSRA
jgi:hypothetical protein